ncbi:hypothetical protein C6A85_64395, partial [Mycobacterium sp. ITM-2017-0098]
GVGPARYLATTSSELHSLLAPALAGRVPFAGDGAMTSKHLLIVLDDPDADPGDFIGRGLEGVTVIHRSAKDPHREQYSNPERPILRIA